MATTHHHVCREMTRDTSAQPQREVRWNAPVFCWPTRRAASHPQTRLSKDEFDWKPRHVSNNSLTTPPHPRTHSHTQTQTRALLLHKKSISQNKWSSRQKKTTQYYISRLNLLVNTRGQSTHRTNSAPCVCVFTHVHIQFSIALKSWLWRRDPCKELSPLSERSWTDRATFQSIS